MKFLGPRAHKECLKEIQTAHVLWLLISGQGKHTITYKVFEYLGSGKPIIATVCEGFAKEFLKSFQGVYIADYGDVDEIKRIILELYDKFKCGKLTEVHRNLDEFSYENITKKLIEIFKKVTRTK